MDQGINHLSLKEYGAQKLGTKLFSCTSNSKIPIVLGWCGYIKY